MRKRKGCLTVRNRWRDEGRNGWLNMRDGDGDGIEERSIK